MSQEISQDLRDSLQTHTETEARKRVYTFDGIPGQETLRLFAEQPFEVAFFISNQDEKVITQVVLGTAHETISHHEARKLGVDVDHCQVACHTHPGGDPTPSLGDLFGQYAPFDIVFGRDGMVKYSWSDKLNPLEEFHTYLRSAGKDYLWAQETPAHWAHEAGENFVSYTKYSRWLKTADQNVVRLHMRGMLEHHADPKVTYQRFSWEEIDALLAEIQKITDKKE